MKKFRLPIIAAFVLATLMFTGCSKEENMLVGMWYKYYDGQVNQILQFNSSGTFSHIYNVGTSISWTREGTWSYDKNSRTLVTTNSETMDSRTFYVQSLTKEQLVLIESDGDSYTFVKYQSNQ